jgi:hypothetical protein
MFQTEGQFALCGSFGGYGVCNDVRGKIKITLMTFFSDL